MNVFVNERLIERERESYRKREPERERRVRREREEYSAKLTFSIQNWKCKV